MIIMKDLGDSDTDAPLFKDREDLLEIVNEYEKWFELLVDEKVCITVEHRVRKKKVIIEHVNAVVSKFRQGIGWVAHDEFDNMYEICFNDLISGRIVLQKNHGHE